MRHYSRLPLRAFLLILLAASFALAQRTQLQPGRWNFFSPKEEVELGRQVAQDAEQKLPMLNDSRVDDYLNRLGRRLAAKAPGEKYPYQFKCVNDANINAFALPGGFLYVNRGTIEAADNEAELAGVIGHEIGHVALRHGTNQATKSYLTQFPLAILGGMAGNSVGGILAQIGTQFATSSILLRYSRDDERQADLMSTQILYDSNYDPRYVARFFEKLEGRQGTEFFSSHPNPDNRIRLINDEIGRIGPIPKNSISDSREFRNIKQYLKSLPPAPKAGSAPADSRGSAPPAPPAQPSARFASYDAGILKLRHPDNWRAYGNEQTFTFAPEGGIAGSGSSEALAYGTMISIYTPRSTGRSRTLRQATDELVGELRKSNPDMRLSKDHGQIRVGGQAAMSRILTNNSAYGGREMNWLVTALRPEGLVYFIFVAPEGEFGRYQRTFRQILDSVTFRRR
ncbi:MAG: M48 family metalloprotease [Acidobacteria bacterium]|nr:M48 family metalloprotease [Acidobacteriota bacterium]